LIKSLCDTLVPKLVAEDIPLLSSLLQGVFPGSSIIQLRDQELATQFDILKVKYNLVNSVEFLEKVLQIY
jgi:dynein heavy chain 1